jgi:hypothetical protein
LGRPCERWGKKGKGVVMVSSIVFGWVSVVQSLEGLVLFYVLYKMYGVADFSLRLASCGLGFLVVALFFGGLWLICSSPSELPELPAFLWSFSFLLMTMQTFFSLNRFFSWRKT